MRSRTAAGGSSLGVLRGTVPNPWAKLEASLALPTAAEDPRAAILLTTSWVRVLLGLSGIAAVWALPEGDRHQLVFLALVGLGYTPYMFLARRVLRSSTGAAIPAAL